MCDRPARRRCLLIALVVGTILAAINQGDVLLRGDFTPLVAVKLALNYLVPFAVSSLGFISARRAGCRLTEVHARRSPHTAPMTVDSHSMRGERLVSMRATTAGTTSAAAMSVTPRTFMVARIDERQHEHQQGVDAPVCTPDASATSGSKVVNSRRPVAQTMTAAASARHAETTTTSLAADAEDVAEQRARRSSARAGRTAEEREPERERRRRDRPRWRRRSRSADAA